MIRLESLAPEDTLSVADLARLLKISTRTIHNRRSKCPDSLPEADRYPRCKEIHFKVSKVRQWLEDGCEK